MAEHLGALGPSQSAPCQSWPSEDPQFFWRPAFTCCGPLLVIAELDYIGRIYQKHLEWMARPERSCGSRRVPTMLPLSIQMEFCLSFSALHSSLSLVFKFCLGPLHTHMLFLIPDSYQISLSCPSFWLRGWWKPWLCCQGFPLSCVQAVYWMKTTGEE